MRIFILFYILCIPSFAISSQWQTVVDDETLQLQQVDEQDTKQPIKRQEQPALKTDTTDEPDDSLATAIGQGGDFFRQMRQNGKEEQETVTATIEFVKQLTGIADAGLSDDNCTIWLVNKDGFSGMIIFKSIQENDKKEQTEHARREQQQRAPISEFSNFSASAQPNKKRAIILEPFESKDSKSGDLKDGSPEMITRTLKEAGIEVTHLRGTEVKIGQFAELGQYDIVYIHTHTGYKKGNCTWMSGEKITEEKTKKYREQYGDSVYIGETGTLIGSGIKTYSINADFIRQIKPFNNSIVYVSGCNSNSGKEKNTMSKALKERGASVYLGYDGLMMGGYATANTDVKFFDFLMQGYSIEEAINQKPSGHYGYAQGFKFAGRLRAGGKNLSATVEIEKDKRIAILKNEHRRLQGVIEALKDKIQADPRNAKVTSWEKKMTRIRSRQKDIYQRVLALKKGTG